MNTPAFSLRKAERKQAKLRIGLTGPSGSGKTYSALLLAYGITGDWSKIALIDTENGSGELYADLGPYNVITLTAPYTPERYIAAIEAAEQAGMEVIIIDSASHEWEGKGGILELVDQVAAAKFKGNSWAAWSELTPRHQKFIEKITTSPTHIIVTTRAKTDTTMTDEGKVKKLGTKEIQREGFEYELTINFTLDRDLHLATASKDRTGLFIDRDPFLITPEIGKELMEWNKKGKLDVSTLRAELVRECKRLDAPNIGGMPKDKNDAADYIRQTVEAVLGRKIENTPEALKEIVDGLKKVTPEQAKEMWAKRFGGQNEAQDDAADIVDAATEEQAEQKENQDEPEIDPETDKELQDIADHVTGKK